MKKVLIITYYWPPSGGGGVQRWLKFVKYFHRFGWSPVVFTPKNPEYPTEDYSLLSEIPKDTVIIRNKIWEPYAAYKRFTGKAESDRIQTAFLSEKKTRLPWLENLAIWIRGNLFIPDARKFWVKPSVRYLRKFLNKYPVDVIVTTGPPHSTHLIGLKLHKELGLPWLADFRDPWTNIDFYENLKLGKRADKLHHKMEKEVLEMADAVSVVSPGMKREFLEIVNRKYYVIPNGFDREDVNLKQKVSVKRDKFIISHIGSLTPTRNSPALWKVLKELVHENKVFAGMLEIRNVGSIDFQAIESIKKQGVEKYLTRIDYIPHEDVIVEQHQAAVLLLLINNTPNSKLILTGRLFEYLASGHPIISIGPLYGDAARIITETNCGKVFDFSDEKNLKKEIIRLFDAFINDKEKPVCKNVEKFERQKLTEKMSEVLLSITSSKPSK